MLEKTGVDIILGCDFLTKYDCKLDFSTATITINGIEIEMKTEPTSISQNDPDRILTDKAKIYQALDPKELNKDPLAYLQSFINHIKQNNPILGFINTQNSKYIIMIIFQCIKNNINFHMDFKFLFS